MKRLKKWLYLFSVVGALNLGLSAPTGAEESPVPEVTVTVTPTPEITVAPTPVPVENGWKTTTAGKKYLVDGIAVKGLYTISGKTYVFSTKGILQLSKWTLISGKKYYSNASGILVRNKLIKTKGNYYYVKEDGTALKNAWKTFSKGKSYFGSDGIRYTGIKKIGGKTYGFNAAGLLVKNGWVKKDGKYYAANASGIIVKNKVFKVGDYYYYLDSNGVRQTKLWKTFTAGKSYFDSKGRRVTGERKIGQNTYYFTGKGYLAVGKTSITSGNTTYYLDGNGIVEMKATQSGSATKYYGTSGSEISFVKARDYLTLIKARSIASEITTSAMTKEQKLKACFDWVVKKYYKTWRTFTAEEGWPAVFANDHFTYGCGNCHSDAAAFAYLAKAVGYTNVYVCSDAATTDAHSWTEIDGRAYDPLFWEAKGKAAKYYGGSYGSYELYPILHIEI